MPALSDGAAVMQLYPFQQAIVDEYTKQVAAGVRRIMLVVATGGGKTVIASDIITAANAVHKKIVFIAHRNELLTQGHSKLQSFGVNAGIIKSGRDKDARPLANVQICGIQTLHARAIRGETMEMPPADIVFIDECHHVPAMTYQAILARYPDAIVVGLTATPCRGDGRGLGNTFDAMVQGPQIGELIKLGYLCPLKIFAPPAPDLKGVGVASTGDYVVGDLSRKMNTQVLVGDLVEHWLRHAQRRRTVVFAVDISHSVDIVKQFQKSEVRAEHVDGATPQPERDAIIARLASGETEVVSNCGVFTEGFDLPELGCIALVRPTRSLGLFRQMIGRGLRSAPGKTDVVVLDHSGGVHRFGRPDDAIEWTLDIDKRATNAAHAARLAERHDPFCECKACGHLRMRGMACDNCGYKPSPKPRAVGYVDANLVELGKTNAPTEPDRVAFYCELRGHQLTARKKDGSPYHPKWSDCQFKDKFKIWPDRSWSTYAPLEPSIATLRWIKSRQIAWAKRRNAA